MYVFANPGATGKSRGVAAVGSHPDVSVVSVDIGCPPLAIKYI
jgi:hypothetical protein